MEKLISVLISKVDAKQTAKKQAFIKVINAKLDNIYLTSIQSQEDYMNVDSNELQIESMNSQTISTISIMIKSFIFETIKIMYSKHIKYDDFETFVDGLITWIFSFQNTNKIQIFKTSDILAYIDSVAEGEEHHQDSDSEDDKLVHLSEQEKLNKRLIFIKYILKDWHIGLKLEETDSVTKDAIYQMQPNINKLINLKSWKETLLIIPTDTKSAVPTISVLNETFAFVSNLLDIFASYSEVIPTTFNIEHYLPIWLSFCNMKACETLSQTLTKNLLKVFSYLFSQKANPQTLKTLGNIISSVLNVMMSVKSLNNSLSFFYFLESALKVNEFIFSQTVRDTMIYKNDAESYKFILTLLTK